MYQYVIIMHISLLCNEVLEVGSWQRTLQGFFFFFSFFFQKQSSKLNLYCTKEREVRYTLSRQVDPDSTDYTD